jgi:hypothetical protein
VIEHWRKLQNVELHELLFSPNMIHLTKSRRLRWAGHMELLGKSDVNTRFCWGNSKVREHLEDRGVDGPVLIDTMKV